MTYRQTVAIMTAILRAQNPALDGDSAVLAAIAIVRGGMGEGELVHALAVIARGGDGCTPLGILQDVDFAFALRGAAVAYTGSIQ